MLKDICRAFRCQELVKTILSLNWQTLRLAGSHDPEPAWSLEGKANIFQRPVQLPTHWRSKDRLHRLEPPAFDWQKIQAMRHTVFALGDGPARAMPDHTQDAWKREGQEFADGTA